MHTYLGHVVESVVADEGEPAGFEPSPHRRDDPFHVIRVEG